MSAPTAPMLDRAQWGHLNDDQFEVVCALATIFGTEALPVMLTQDTAVHSARLNQYAQLVNLHASPAIVEAETKAREEIERSHQEVHATMAKAQEAVESAQAAAQRAVEQATESATAQVRAIQETTAAQIQRVTEAAGAEAQLAQKLQQMTVDKATFPSATAIKPVKIAFGKYSGREDENLRRWLLEVEEANAAARYSDARTQVAMAMSHLVGTARDWAFTCIAQAKATGTEAFPSWEAFKHRLEANFHGEHARHNDRAKFLRTRQHKKSVFEFIQTLRQLSAAVIGEPLDETTKITILREGLNVGPARTQLFRKNPTTFEDACQIALNEDACQRRAHNSRIGPDSSSTRNGPTPMEIGSTDLARQRHSNHVRMELGSTDLARQRQLSNVRCFKCNRPGHYARDCRKNRSNNQFRPRPFRSGSGSRPSRPTSARRVHFRTPHPHREGRNRSNSTQGNASAR